MWIFLNTEYNQNVLRKKELGTENEIGKGWGKRYGEGRWGKLYRGGDEGKNVAKNKRKMREGIRGSVKTMDVGWDEGK